MFSHSLRRTAVLALSVMLTASLALAGQPQKPKVPPTISDADIAKIEAALPAKATAKPQKARKVLVFWRCEGFFHGAGIAFGNKALELMGQKTGAFETVITDDYAMFDAEKLKQFDAVVFNNTTKVKLDEQQRKALLDFINGGKGVLGMHAAADNFYDFPEMAKAMGGLFDGHPWGGGGTWAIKIDEPDHPLNKGFAGKGFLIKDEIYQLKAPYSRETHRVLVTLDMDNPRNLKVKGMKRDDKDFAISQACTMGQGRAFYCGLGHNGVVFQTPGVLQHYLDAMQYVLGDLEVDVKPSATLKVKPKPATTGTE